MSSPQTNPLTYNGYVSQIATMAVLNTQTTNGVVEGVDSAFNELIPQMLNYAELRIQRDLDLLPSQTTNTYTMTSGNNLLTLDVDDFVTVQTVQLTVGTAKLTVLPASKEYIQTVYNDSSVTGKPTVYAMYGGDLATGGDSFNYILFGPYPDSNYPVLITGTVRLPSLYKYGTPVLAATGKTFISTYLPDLLIQASMIYISQFQRNFGSAANDPAMGPTYELQYQNLLKSAIVEEARKKFQASAWSSMSPPMAASPTR
jgi:hypothetical protein